MKPKGWVKEPARHALSARGIRTRTDPMERYSRFTYPQYKKTIDSPVELEYENSKMEKIYAHKTIHGTWFVYNKENQVIREFNNKKDANNHIKIMLKNDKRRFER